MFENDLRKNEQFNTYVINNLNDVSLSFRKPYSIDTDKTTNPWTTTLKNISFFSLVRNCTVTIVGLFDDKCKETEGFSKELDTSNLPASQICGYGKTRKKYIALERKTCGCLIWSVVLKITVRNLGRFKIDIGL